MPSAEGQVKGGDDRPPIKKSRHYSFRRMLMRGFGFPWSSFSRLLISMKPKGRQKAWAATLSSLMAPFFIPGFRQENHRCHRRISKLSVFNLRMLVEASRLSVNKRNNNQRNRLFAAGFLGLKGGRLYTSAMKRRYAYPKLDWLHGEIERLSVVFSNQETV